MRIELVIVLLLSLTLTSEAVPSKSEIQHILSYRNMKMESKSDRGWIRLINNPVRMEKYNFSEEEKEDMYEYFINSLKSDRCAKARVLK